MAVANRFTQITPSRFNPLSYNEVMATPLMQRTKHDQLAAQQEMLRQGLAKVAPHEKYFNEALNIKSGINDQINSQVDLLSREGINPNTTSSFIKLNREYNDLMSPTGKLGQINNHNINLQKTYNDYLKQAVEAGNSPQIAKLHADKAIKQHLSQPLYDERGRVNDFKIDQGPSKFIDVPKRVQEYAKEAGMTSSEWAKASGALSFDQSGNKYVINSNAKGLNSSNLNQLQAVLNTLNNEISDPTSEVRQSLDYNFRNPQSVLDDVRQQLSIYQDTKTSNETGSSIGSVDWYKPEDASLTGTIISNNSTLKSDALDIPNYSNVMSEINRLKNSESLNPADRAKLDDLRELQASAEVKMLKDPNYLKVNNEYTSLKKQLGDAITKKYKNEYSTRPTTLNPEGKKINPQNLIKQLESGDFSVLNDLDSNDRAKGQKLKELITRKSDIQNKYWKQSSSMRHDYSYLPSTPKEESNWNLHNENVFNTLKGIGDIGNALDLTSIHTTGGTKKNLTTNDVSNIQDLIKSADPKTFKINNVKTYGDNKTPEITVSFNTLEGANEYDTKGVAWNDEYGGSNKPVTMTFKLKRLSNAPDSGSAPGFKNLTGAIAGFYKDKGGVNEITGNPQGKEVYNSLIENAYQDLSNEQLYQRAQTDSDAREALMIRVAKRQKQ